MVHRKAQVVNSEGLWVDLEPHKIRKNDTFRIFDEISGEMIVDNKGRREWVASCNPFLNKYGEFAINVYQ